MLQLINPNAVQATGPATAEVVAASPLEATQVQAEPVFDLLLAEDVPVPGMSPGETLPLERPAEHVEVDAERWLNSMLEQHEALIEARESALALPSQQVSVPLDEHLGQAAMELPVLPAGMAQQQVAQDGLLAERQVQTQAARPGVSPVMDGGQGAPVQSVLSAMLAGHAQSAHTQTEAVSQGAPSTVDATVAGALLDVSRPQAARQVQTLALHASQAQWGEQMLQSLRDSVDMQINQRIQSTTIRLDPPELGSLEIFLSHEAGRINVQLSAGNADVARLLLQTSDRLRQELIAQNFVQVNVQVSADAQGGRQHGHAARPLLPGDEPIQAARAGDDDQRTHQDSASDVLVTV